MYIFSGTCNSTLLVCQCILLSCSLKDAPLCSSPLPDCRGGCCRALEPLVILTSSQPCWSWFGSGQEEECVQGSPPHGGLRSVLTPKGQNQHSKPQNPALAADGKLHQSTQPLPALFSPGFRSNLQPTIFVTTLVKGPSHQSGDTHGAVLMGMGSSTGHCRKLADGHRSLPAR